MRETSAVMQFCCASAVVAGISASLASEKLHMHRHLHGPKRHGMRVSTVCTLLKLSATPIKTTGARGSAGQRTPLPQYYG